MLELENHLIRLVPVLNAPTLGVKNGFNDKQVGDGVAHRLVRHVHQQLKLLSGSAGNSPLTNDLWGGSLSISISHIKLTSTKNGTVPQ